MNSLTERISRRDFLRLTTGVVVVGVGIGRTGGRAGASTRKTLTIAQCRHPVPEYDEWFRHEFARDWGKKNDTNVAVDFFDAVDIDARASAEIAAGSGHDLFMFPVPPPKYEVHTIDHGDIYRSAGRKYGRVSLLGHKSTYNPLTRRYFAFNDSFIPAPLLFDADYWGKINMPYGPATIADLIGASRDIRDKFSVPCGLNFGPGITGNVTLLTLFSTLGADIQDALGRISLGSDRRATYAFDYVKNLYDMGGGPAMLASDPRGNVDAFVAQKTSSTISSIAAIRNLEKSHPDLARKFRLTPALRTPHRQMAYPQITSCYVVWNFASNPDGAKRFLVDLVDNARTGFQKSAFCNFPSFINAVPDLAKQLANDPHADPPYKYAQLQDTLHWVQNLGYPGYATAGFMEVFGSFTLPKICAKVLGGELTPESAASTAADEVARCYSRPPVSQTTL